MGYFNQIIILFYCVLDYEIFTKSRIRLSKITLILSVLCIFYFFTSSLSYSIEETHPFILYTSEDVGLIRERLSQEPYQSWFTTVIREADLILQKKIAWNQTEIPKVTQGYYAKMLAFAYVFTDSSSENHETYGDEAARALYHIPDSDYKNNFSDDLSISEAVYYWAVTYDILKGAGFDFAVEGYSNMDSMIRSKFKNIRDYMARDFYEDLTIPPKPSIQRDFFSVAFDNQHITVDRTDNHHVKLYASLTLLSLVIYDESGSNDDFSRGESRLLAVLNNMTITGDNGEPVGGWAEGPGYHNYSMNQYIPALTALKNKGILDLNTIPELIQTHLWLSKIVMPDGYLPPMDDNEAVIDDWSGILYSLHNGVPERDMLYWMWDIGGKKVNKAFLPDYISQFDNTHPVYTDPVKLGWNPTGFFPESGFARFRSSWDKNAVYSLFLTEHGEARKNGQAHEHPDPNSFIIHAYSDMLLLDSGYGGWAEHDYTRFAKNHNLILIDGEGPDEASQGSLFQFWDANGANAYLTEYFTSRGIDYAMSTTKYCETDFSRSIMFPDHEYFLVFDRVSSDMDRTFTLLFHGNGGATSGGSFSEKEWGALWGQENAVLRSYTIGSSDLNFTTEDMNHAVYNRTPMLSHTVLKVSQSGTNECFLSLLYPEKKNVPIPNITQINVTNGKGIRIDRDNTTDYAVICLGDSTVNFETDLGMYTSDGEFVYVSIGPETDIRQFFFINGTLMTAGQNPLIRTSNPVNLSANYQFSSDIEGNIQAEQVTDTRVTIYNIKPLNVTYRNEAIPFNTQDNTVSFKISGEGAWKIERAESEAKMEPYELPTQYSMEQPYPNPFNTSVFIQYKIPIECHVKLDIYDVLGRKIVTLENDKLNAGSYKSIWDGKDKNDSFVGSGIYLYRFKAGDYINQGKVLLLK